ncbi:hypothetical protein [Scopulibacillus cellulosilyticus]|uniref:Lipoprotein n=1 Tax=Scopulibacillus cellulosilyticus TaxID=2665665 RepID=A0ABW2PR14_9BACL
MKKLMKQLALAAGFCLIMTLAITACSNGEKGNNADNNINNNGHRKQNVSYNKNNINTPQNQNGNRVDLKNYSKDQDKNTGDEDFDVTGKYVKENNNEIVLNINGDDIHIKKAAGYKKDLKGFKGSLKDKKVDVEVTHNQQLAKDLQPTPMTRADKNGVYERKHNGEVKVIGKLLSSDKSNVSIQVPNGKKTYTKTSDFKVDTDGQKVSLNGKIVRLEIDKHGKLKELKYNWVDQE